MKKRVVIVGAGVAGLAIAVRLAVKGFAVEVFESNQYPGGKLTSFTLDGFRFDAGPSLFTMPELVDELFELAGRGNDSPFRYKKLDEICRYFYEDGTTLTAGADTMGFAREVEAKLGVKSSRIQLHLKKSAYIYRVTSRLFLGKSLHKISSYISLDTAWSFFQLPFLNIFRTMHSANKKALGQTKLVQLFDRYATYNGSNPYKAPGILNIIPHLEFTRGAYFPDGGMISITRHIHELAQSLGVNFHFSQNVERIVVENGVATGIEVKGKRIDADLVVCNMDVVPAYRQLMPEQKQPEKILRQERSSSALIYYWGVRKEFDQLKLHNIFFSQDYEGEFNAIFNQNEISNDPTVYVHISSKEEQSDAPQGMENWFVMINVPADKGQNWDSLITEARSHIIQKINRMLDIDLEELIVCEDLLEPRSIEARTRSFQGALYGTASNNRMAAFFRHPNFSSRIRSLYFCGGSVHPGGGIPLALSSAKIVDGLIRE